MPNDSRDLSKRYQRYHRAVRRALREEWNPIGFGDLLPDDEYDSYVPQVCKLLIQRRPVEEVFNYLWQIETETMGLNPTSLARSATKRFAERLLEISTELESENGSKPD